jgi:hypothetical protein
MSDEQKLEFTHASYVDRDDLTSLVLEARIGNHEVVSIAEVNGEWIVYFEAPNKGTIAVKLSNVCKIITKFAEFIQSHEEWKQQQNINANE